MSKRTTPQFQLEPIPIETSLASWYTEGHAGSMKELVYNSNFRKGEALLKEQARPTRASLRDTETNNVSNAWYAGYCDAFRDLRRLCHAPSKLQQSFDTEGWKHININTP